MTAVGAQIREIVEDLDKQSIPRFDPMKGKKLSLKQRIEVAIEVARVEGPKPQTAPTIPADGQKTNWNS